MVQIVSAKRSANGNFILEVKELPDHRLSASGENVHVAGVQGWAEPLGLTIEDPDGNNQPLFATVDIRYRNPHVATKKKVRKPLTAEDLKAAAKKN